jgi:succinate dehydrogenase hydrophobic anchor subunit
MTLKQTTFLPNLLMDEIGKTGLAGPPVLLFQGKKINPQNKNFNWPTTILWILVFLLIAEIFWTKTSQKTSDRIDFALFAVSGILGLFLLFLWIFSLHISLRFNLNILWANPLLLLMLWTIPTGKRKLSQVILLLYGLLMFFLLINWNKMPQKFPMEMMPIVTFLAFRAINRVFQFKKKIDDKIFINS